MMLNPSPTELTTAATDGLMAIVSAVIAWRLGLWRDANPWKVTLWRCVFGLLGGTSIIAALAHGIAMSEAANVWLFRPVYAGLGIMVGLIALGALHDVWGEPLSRRLLPVALVLAVVFYGITEVFHGSFMVFIVWEAATMSAALACYVWLALRHRAGARWMALGVLVSLVAAGVQSIHGLRLHLIWDFDNNGIFHLIQIPGLWLLHRGLVRGLKVDAFWSAPTPPSPSTLAE